MRSRIGPILFLACAVLSAADFEDHQAARAVIGQPNFSAHDKGITARALSFSQGSLYVADVSGRVLTYNLSQIGASKTPGCPVCLTVPQAVTAQNVLQGIAAVAVNGRKIAVADAKSHSVMIWNGVSPAKQPDIVISGFLNPASVALDNQRLFVGDSAAHHVFIWNAVPTSDSQPADVTLGISDSVDTFGADTIQAPAALASDGENLFVADASAHRILVFSPAVGTAPQVTNAATLTPGPLAPGTIVTVDHASSPRTTVFLNGASIPITETIGDQLQVQVPYELNNAASATLWLKSELEDGSSLASRPVALRFTLASPGIFAFGATEPRTGILLHAPDRIPLSPEDPAKPSDLLIVWATGLGAVANEANVDGAFDTLTPVRATIGGTPVDVISASLPADATGVYEVRLRLPAQLSPGAMLVLIQSDSKSNAVSFPIASN